MFWNKNETESKPINKEITAEDIRRKEVEWELFKNDPKNQGYYLELTLINKDIVKTAVFPPYREKCTYKENNYYLYDSQANAMNDISDIATKYMYWVNSELCIPTKNILTIAVKQIDNCNKV